jgi:hypothetical protein
MDAGSGTRRPGRIKKAQRSPVISLNLLGGTVSRSGDHQKAHLGRMAPGRNAMRVVPRDGLIVPPMHQQDRTGDPAPGVDRTDGFEAGSDQPLNLADHQAWDGVR